jgi:hypothetical protein
VTTKSHILLAIRTKCLDCSVCQPSEVRLCPVKTCALWPFRFGSDPAPATRGFGKTSVCTGNSLGRIVPATGIAQLRVRSKNPSPTRTILRKALRPHHSHRRSADGTPRSQARSTEILSLHEVPGAEGRDNGA